jgi:hypothetical protein
MSQVAEAPAAAEPRGGRGLAVFFAVAGGLLLLRLLLAFFTVPSARVSLILSVLVTAVFVGAPIYGLFRGASFPWTWKSALAVLGGGALLHVLALISVRGLPEVGFATVLVSSIGQFGIIVWCLGLGAVLSLLIRDKNLLLPIAIFLAGFDAFLVLTPGGVVQQLMTNQPTYAESVLVQAPAVRTTPTTPEEEGIRLTTFAQIGPADLLFSATFFIALFKFRMRVRETARWLIPVLVVYMFIVLAPIPGSAMLPALVPIGLTLLIVNAREFKMSSQEKAATAGVAVIAVALAGYALWLRANQPPPEPEYGGELPPGYEQQEQTGA